MKLKDRPSEVDENYNIYVASLRFDHAKFFNHFLGLAKKMIHNQNKLNSIFSKVENLNV